MTMYYSKHYLEKACSAYDAMDEFRNKRERLVRFSFGDQWSDEVPDFDGSKISEGELFKRDGKYIVSVNLIRRVIRMLVGRFRSQWRSSYDPSPTSIDGRNALYDLDSRLLEEFIISGCAIQRIVAERRPEGSGVWIDNVDPRRFFVNSITDPRGCDIDFIGVITDYSWPRFLNRFSKGKAGKAEELRAVFDANCSRRIVVDEWTSQPTIQLFELWSYEPVTYRHKRLEVEMRWVSRHIAPDGTVVLQKTSDFPHQSHPFAVKFYPLVNGQIHSYVEDLIDRQKAINRMLTTFEATIATAAKGVLLFPQCQLLKGITYDDIAALWARPDSVIPIAGGDELPHQLITNANATGIVPIVDMQLKLFDEASGMTDVLRGGGLPGNIDSESRKALIDNAATSVTDILDTFKSFIDFRNAKAAQTLSGEVKA